jgi:hypothetical protein
MEVNTVSNNPVVYYPFLDVNNYMINPTVILILAIVVIGFVLLSTYLGNSGTTVENMTSGFSQNIFIGIIVFIIIVLIAFNAFKYFFSVDIYAYVSGLFSGQPKIDIVVDQSSYESSSVPTIRWKKQVFNIPGNYYDYNNAKALCKAYGAELATYKQLEEAYDSGAEWCNYGWSQGQMALFPTQQKTFDNLQKIPGHEHDCGRPGINGGYIANPNVRFGVNCYGNKPKIDEEERTIMENASPYPVTMEDIAFQKQVDYWKQHVDDIIVSPFNNKTWSQL